MSMPSLIVVSGPPGSGKTTLAHLIAREVGCPAICRDELKEGMVHAYGGSSEGPGFVAGPSDELTVRAYPAFFGTVEYLLRAGSTVVAEAAFQDKLWRPGLTPLLDLARLRIVRCQVAADVAVQRMRDRMAGDPLRAAAHGDHSHLAALPPTFDPIHLDAPTQDVDTTTPDYSPNLSTIATFARS